MHVTHMRACHTAGSRVVPRNLRQLRPFTGRDGLLFCITSFERQQNVKTGAHAVSGSFAKQTVCGLRSERPGIQPHITEKERKTP